MTDEQRRFKIEQVKNYEKKLKEEDKDVKNNTIGVGFSALCIVCGLGVLSCNLDLSTIQRAFGAPSVLIGSGTLAVTLKNLITAIGSETVLFGRIRTLLDEIEFDENFPTKDENERDSNPELEEYENDESRGMHK